MKKITKQAIIWSSVALGLGGLAAGIAIPIINDHKERQNINPINLTGNEQVMEGSKATANQMMNEDKSSIEVRNSKLLGNTQHQLAFYLYEQEQKASVKVQRAFFEWHKHEVLKNLEDFYKNTLHEAGEAVGDTIDKKYDDIVAKIQAKITSLPSGDDKNSKQHSLDNMKTDWRNNLDKIHAIDNNTVNYNGDRFIEKYPKVLLPLSNIQTKHSGIYNDQKKAHVEAAATKDAGEKSWFAGLSQRFHGATSEADAIEGMVFNEIRGKAYARFQYAIDSAFTYEQFESGVFKDFLGKPTITVTAADGTSHESLPTTDAEITQRDADALKNYGVAIKKSHEKKDKIFFLASHSNVAEWLNPVKGKQVDGFKGLHHLTRTHNAILGFKQDKTNPNAPWAADKGMLANLFKVFVDGSSVTQVSEAWKDIFKDNDDAAKKLTQRLVQNYSLTTDSTQSRSGDLGISTTLDSFAPMAPGFALGVLSILNSHLPGVTTPTMITEPDFLKNLMDDLKSAFAEWTKAKGITLTVPTSAAAGSTPDLAIVQRYNEQIDDIINHKMTDDDRKSVFGTAIRDTYHKLEAAHHTAHGVPLAIKIAEETSTDAATLGKVTGIYAVLSEKFGLHIIKYEQNSPASFKDELDADLKQAVEKQDTKAIATNYAGLLLKNLTSLGKLAKLLNLQKDAAGNFSIGDKAVLDYLKTKAKELGYDNSNIANLGHDIATMIGRLRNSEHISEVQKAVQDTTTKWLQDKLDKLLIADDATTIKPEDIYNIVSRVDAEIRNAAPASGAGGTH